MRLGEGPCWCRLAESNCRPIHYKATTSPRSSRFASRHDS
ncbi:hypothetical protein CZ674_11445 [Agrococcus casei LMG 22410]|uniref:Uncharacterized protein n=1 Tax=Agrococcus casei LMG 22410 TaxID=1255656 RepID=A0A1R4GF67_9MICO|nr:hypothetical protein CZ674_11445 [Agrococcus casei LMG 22410]